MQITYADFVRLCRVDDPDTWAPWLRIEPEGIWARPAPKEVALTPEERAALVDYPGHDLAKPLLTFPCSLDELRQFLEKTGTYGSIDAFDMAKFAAAAGLGQPKTTLELDGAAQGDAVVSEHEGEEEADEELAALFDPVTVATLEKMFPAGDRWKQWAERAKRNGLSIARVGRGMYNPYLASTWFLGQGRPGWDRAKCDRVLANNLPARSRHESHLLTGDLD